MKELFMFCVDPEESTAVNGRCGCFCFFLTGRRSPVTIYIFGNQYKELHEEHIRNDSILSVGQSKKNIYTDTRIENFHDEDRGISITGFFKYGNQYKELHEDTVISFPFYEITFDILL